MVTASHLRLALLALALARCEADSTFPTGRDTGCDGLAEGVRCVEDQALTCGPNGLVRARARCGDGERCFDSYGCGVCEPGAVDCSADGETPRRCEADHRWRSEPSCDVTQVCEVGRCIRGCDPDPSARETRGCEFWATQTIHRGVEPAQRASLPFTVITANPWRRDVQFGAEGTGLSGAVRVVSARGTHTLEQPWIPALVDGADPSRPRSGVVRRGAARVRTSIRVAAWQFNPLATLGAARCEGATCRPGGDGSTLLPVSALGRVYLVATRATERVRPPGGAWRGAPGFISVVGTEAGTRVTVILQGAIEASLDGSVPAATRGERVEVTLGEGDVLQLLSAYTGDCAGESRADADGTLRCAPSLDDDLTGSRVQATAPVAVFVGHDCARVSPDRAACDHVEEQVPPLETLGPRYVISPAPSGTTVVRIVSGYDNTELRAEPAGVLAPRTMRSGEVLELTLDRAAELIASRPVLVATFTGSADGAAMAFESPIVQWRSVSEVFAPFGFATTLDLATVSGSGVRLDGNLVRLDADTRLPGRAVWRVEVAPGLHRVTGANPMDLVGVRALGGAARAAFMVRGGGDLRAVPVPD